MVDLGRTLTLDEFEKLVRCIPTDPSAIRVSFFGRWKEKTPYVEFAGTKFSLNLKTPAVINGSNEDLINLYRESARLLKETITSYNDISRLSLDYAEWDTRKDGSLTSRTQISPTGVAVCFTGVMPEYVLKLKEEANEIGITFYSGNFEGGDLSLEDFVKVVDIFERLR